MRIFDLFSSFTNILKLRIVPQLSESMEEISIENRQKDLSYFKDKTFCTLSLVFIFAGGLSILAGAFMFFINGNIHLAALEILIYIFLTFVLLNRNIQVRFKKYLFVATSYILSLIVLIFAGSGAGLHVTMAVIIISGCILKFSEFKLFYVINIAVFILISFLLYNGNLNNYILSDFVNSWLISIFNLQILTYGTMYVINQIYLDLSNQNKLVTKRESELLNLTYSDGMTGLYNRRYFEKIISEYNDSSFLPVSIIIGDINGLKLINDAFGHDQGDIIIKETASILKSLFRENYIISRTGGDEFSIILPNTSQEMVEDFIKDLNDKIDNYNNNAQNDSFLINISLGHSTKSKISQDINKTIKLAEELMYKRKLLDHQSLHYSILSSIKATMAEKNNETKEHAQRIAFFTTRIGHKLNLSEDEISNLILFSELHDLGKIGIDDTILNKDSDLDKKEWNEMKKHPEKGYRIAASIKEFEPVADLILTHHESWDGNGYPRNLKGEDIPLLSRILAVVDAYDAMTNDRPYRKALTRQQAIAEIKRFSGSQFDPSIVNIFIEILVAGV